ncbi:ATPase component of ABC-type sugar transporter [Desulfosporosinus orientis DSM 765]|uniref:ATPase component of ABC-type sugar transporter n=1 Tax=Desulfosporosinus orientis (strain ATCC 19365 / DSM 765 / NCIMB 8382 / VKM B-1628 / Singapore I) TaxID=768706 RepID=G7WGB0_DESOD|nr:sn-glycerol-3-phosphate ABC transporter ATP-binding protein UgpC [Desulfosporosinus orientis]AET70842.1 ATPase component of ABC-type sugar transporter [Desulfosporosinus orientis DSM 765]
MAGLVLRNVVKKFEQSTVVHNFNLEIEDKEFLVLVGPSGCGKSTTLRMIAGLEGISSGEIMIDGKLVNDLAPKDRDIAMVFQSYALYPHMNVFENMAFGLKLNKYPKKEIVQRVKEAAKILEIEHLLERKPKELSGGQRQRVALGRAIVREPKVFLLDEPLSNLDAKLRVQMRAEIAKLRHRLKTTFIYVTHDQTEAMTMGDRIVVMKEGFIQQVDTPMNLYNQPKNMFVASFIGSPAMNFLKAKVREEKGVLCLETPDFRLTSVEERREELASYISKEIVMGIRPEAIYDKESFIEEHPDWALDVTIEVVEPVGSENYVYFFLSGVNMIARMEPSSTAKVMKTHRIALDMRAAHFFDPETQETIPRQ